VRHDGLGQASRQPSSSDLTRCLLHTLTRDLSRALIGSLATGHRHILAMGSYPRLVPAAPGRDHGMSVVPDETASHRSGGHGVIASVLEPTDEDGPEGLPRAPKGPSPGVLLIG
jgi:hypothetical protein